MSYGIRILGKSLSGTPVVLYDSSNENGQFFMVLDVFTLPASGSGTRLLPFNVDLEGVKNIDVLVYPLTGDANPISPIVSVSGSTLSWYIPNTSGTPVPSVVVVSVL